MLSVSPPAANLDVQDRHILKTRVAARLESFASGPQVGDFVDFPGRERPRERIAHDWDEIGLTDRGRGLDLSR